MANSSEKGSRKSLGRNNNVEDPNFDLHYSVGSPRADLRPAQAKLTGTMPSVWTWWPREVGTGD